MEYWQNRSLETSFACPNVSFFRLLGSIIPTLSQQTCLEIGFGHGADLIECFKRGAVPYGLDLNPKYVDAFSGRPEFQTRTFHAGKERIPFEIKFDLIFTRDTIYYLSDKEIEVFFEDCFDNITNGGYLIVQFIEKDYKLSTFENIMLTEFDKDFLMPYAEEGHFEPDNPIRMLNTKALVDAAEKANLGAIGSKVHMETYGNNLDKVRVNRYIVFRK